MDRNNVKFLAKFIRGSHLYGLNTPESDLDYGGLYMATSIRDILGFGRDNRSKRTITTSKEATELDEAYYELRHFINLLQRTNTQVIEALFCPDDLVLKTSPVFEFMRENRSRLISTEHLAKSLFGYLQAEHKLVFGENTGKLGSKRQNAVKSHGYSHKNAVQYIRLAYCGFCMLTHGRYPINLKDENGKLWERLMMIKTDPTSHTPEEISQLIENARAMFDIADKMRVITYKFDDDLADEIMLQAYGPRVKDMFDDLPELKYGKCQCMDCFGDKPGHDPHCEYILDLTRDQQDQLITSTTI